MYAKEELISSLEVVKKDEMLWKVFKAIGKLESATSYEVAKFIGTSFDPDKMKEINDNLHRLQDEDLVALSTDTYDPTNLFISITGKGIDLFRYAHREKYR